MTMRGEPKFADPVCGMRLSPYEVAETVAYHGKVYHFCSALCRRLFEEAPQDYLGKTAPKKER